MNLPYFQVDAFTAQAGRGNPAGVYLLPDDDFTDDHLQILATERGISETGFLLQRPAGWSLRWFTPRVEIPLCGHGTVAAAYVLWEQGLLDPLTPARFYTRSGLLQARRTDDGWIELDFPAFTHTPDALPDRIIATFARPPQAVYFAHDRHVTVLATEAEVRNYRPDFAALRDHRLVITAPADPRAPGAAAAPGPAYDFVSRYFAVPMGVNEDPVTGSAHCALTPYWAARLNKTQMVAYQASARGGYLRLRLEGDRVFIAGQAVTVPAGRAAVPRETAPPHAAALRVSATTLQKP